VSLCGLEAVREDLSLVERCENWDLKGVPNGPKLTKLLTFEVETVKLAVKLGCKFSGVPLLAFMEGEEGQGNSHLCCRSMLILASLLRRPSRTSRHS